MVYLPEKFFSFFISIYLLISAIRFANIYFLQKKWQVLPIFLFYILLKEENDAKIKLVSRKSIPLFYFSRFGWLYDRAI